MQMHHYSPAMAEGLADHIWSTREWLLWPVLASRDHRRTLPNIPSQQSVKVHRICIHQNLSHSESDWEAKKWHGL